MTEHGLESSVVTDVFLPLALAVIMFGMGMSLTGADFRRVTKAPRAVAWGLAGQLVALPILAMGVAVAFHHGFGLSPVLVMGLLLLACCPGGATSNLVTYLARADGALSVTLTSITSLASVVTTPAIFFLTTTIVYGDASIITVSPVQMAALVLVIVAVPVLGGMTLRNRRPDWARRADKGFRIASSLLLAGTIAVVIYENRASFWDMARQSVPAALALNVLALGAGLLLGRLARLGRGQARALSIEVGFQNGTLGIALATAQLNSPQAAIVPGFYSLVMFATGGALAWWWAQDEARRAARGEAPEASTA